MRPASVRLQIRRGDVLLREELLNSEGIHPGAPLRLMAKREGDRLRIQANDLPPVEFQDPFALGAGPKGVFAVVWTVTPATKSRWD